jgi:hypothetical protein
MEVKTKISVDWKNYFIYIIILMVDTNKFSVYNYNFDNGLSKTLCFICKIEQKIDTIVYWLVCL